MNKNNKKEKYSLRSQIVKAMAHPLRLELIDLLQETEICVNDLTDKTGESASTVSKHLSVLKDAGIVESEKRGLSVFYSLTCPCIIDYFKCFEKVLEKKAQIFLNAMKA